MPAFSSLKRTVMASSSPPRYFAPILKRSISGSTDGETTAKSSTAPTIIDLTFTVEAAGATAGAAHLEPGIRQDGRSPVPADANEAAWKAGAAAAERDFEAYAAELQQQFQQYYMGSPLVAAGPVKTVKLPPSSHSSSSSSSSSAPAPVACQRPKKRGREITDDEESTPARAPTGKRRNTTQGPKPKKRSAPAADEAGAPSRRAKRSRKQAVAAQCPPPPPPPADDESPLLPLPVPANTFAPLLATALSQAIPASFVPYAADALPARIPAFLVPHQATTAPPPAATAPLLAAADMEVDELLASDDWSVLDAFFGDDL